MKKLTPFLFGLMMTTVPVSCHINAVMSTPAVTVSPTETPQNISLNGKVFSAVWQQNAGEFRALCYQAYNIAKLRVDEAVKTKHNKPLAVITDIDETFFDNSPYAVKRALEGKDFDEESWGDWTSKAEARAYPGSREFFQYAADHGITVFYITNRTVADKPGTLKNLQNLNFPFADNQHLVVRTSTDNKEERRQAVLRDYDVVVFLGDNLSDFAEVFYDKTQDERNRKTDELETAFGKKFIVLPNSGYGDWEPALPGMRSDMTTEQKDKVLLQNAKSY